MVDATTIHVILVIFIATLIQSTFGFGQALIAVPLLALRLSLAVAAPLSVLIGVAVSGAIVVQDWRKVEIRSATWLIISSLVGIPLGLVLLRQINPRAMNIGLGLIIIAFSVYSLTVRFTLHLKEDHQLGLLSSGFLSGVLTGAYGMGGPPVVVYGALRRWSPQHFRATLQGYFIPTSVAGFIGFLLAGLWGPTVMRFFLFSLPAAALAVFLGRILNHRLRGDAFFRFIYVGLIGVGGLLVARAV